jgi:hypothetical protein
MKKTPAALILLFLLSNALVRGQIIFQKTYGGIKAEHNECFNRSTGVINTTNDNGFVLCHATLSYGSGPFSQGVYFIKIDKNGDTVYTRTFYNPNDHCYGRSVYQTEDGGYILGAAFSTIGAGLIKTDQNGTLLWSKRFSGYHTGYYGLKLNGNMFLATGRSFMAKVDNSGNLVFGKTLSAGGSLPLTLYSSEQCANGDIISVGTIQSGMSGDIFIVKTDASGNVKFSRSYGTSTLWEGGYKAVELSDKSIAVIGFCEPQSGGDYNITLLKADSAGNPLFHKTIGDSYYQWANSIIKDAGDNLYFTGVTTYAGSNNLGSAFLIKASPTGSLLSMNRYDNVEYGNGLVFTAAGELAICGMTAKSGAGGEDLFVIKTNSTGVAGCNINSHTLSVNELTASVSSLISLTVTNNITATDYSLNVKPGAIVSTICYSCSPPSLTISATKNTICSGDKVKLTVSGASTFSWSTGAMSPTVLVSPQVTTTYVVTGSDGSGCSASISYTQNVSKCLGIESEGDDIRMAVYPVPANGFLNIESAVAIDRLELFDQSGKLVHTSQPGSGVATQIDRAGVFLVRITSGDYVRTIKIINTEE